MISLFNWVSSISMQGEALEVKVNKLSSTKTQLPYDYYFLSYCKPSKIRNRAENLGEVLRGDRIESSVYTVSMLFRYTSDGPYKFLVLFVYNFVVVCFSSA